LKKENQFAIFLRGFYQNGKQLNKEIIRLKVIYGHLNEIKQQIKPAKESEHLNTKIKKRLIFFLHPLKEISFQNFILK